MWWFKKKKKKKTDPHELVEGIVDRVIGAETAMKPTYLALDKQLFQQVFFLVQWPIAFQK